MVSKEEEKSKLGSDVSSTVWFLEPNTFKII
jgi:hypothetical protein